MVVLWCSHSAAGKNGLRWHQPLGTGTMSGPASREITGWCGGGGGQLKPASTPCCQPRELLFAASSLLHVSSLPFGDNWRCTLCKQVFCFKLIFAVRRHVYLLSIQKSCTCFHIFVSFFYLTSSAIACLPFLFPPSSPSLLPSPLSVCALITSPNWQ